TSRPAGDRGEHFPSLPFGCGGAALGLCAPPNIAAFKSTITSFLGAFVVKIGASIRKAIPLAPARRGPSRPEPGDFNIPASKSESTAMGEEG
ncbi:MAG: hypothetical protein ACP5O7_09980, partial [Phycisphaerae bacterium]